MSNSYYNKRHLLLKIFKNRSREPFFYHMQIKFLGEESWEPRSIDIGLKFISICKKNDGASGKMFDLIHFVDNENGK